VTRRRSPLPRDTSGFQQVALGVIEQDLGLQALREPGVRAVLREVPFEWAFAWTARIDAEMRNGQLRERAAEAQLQAVASAFHGHPKWKELVELVASEGRELFNTPYVHALQRLLVLEAADGFEERPGDQRRMQDAFLGICNVVSADSERPREFDRNHYLALMTRSAVVNATEAPVDAITRAYAIYYELPRRPSASSMPNYCAPRGWEPDVRRSVSVHERFMIGMAVMGNVGVWGEELPPPERPTGVPPDYFHQLAKELEGGDSARLSRAIAGDRAFFRGMFQREKPGLRGNALNSIPFQVRPLLEQSNGGYLLSSTNALASWMTRGVHYACLTPIEGTPTAQAFLTYVGRLFEAYAVELLEDAHRAQPEVRVLGDQPYDNGASRTTDVAIVDGSDLVLIEIEAHRFTKEALLSGDAEQVLSELDTMILSKARQISQCIDALRRPDSPATLPSIDMADIERIWPVVVIEGGIVQTALLWEHLNEQLGEALQQPGVQTPSVMTMDELEAAAGLVEHDHHLAMLLHRWKFGSAKYTDFTYFCRKTTGLQRRRRATLVERRWKQLTEEVASAFSAEARARLLGDDD
jgi:hypothetical protein